MHGEHGGSQPCHPTDSSGGDCSGYRGLWLVGRDENQEGNGGRSNEIGEHSPLTVSSDKSLVDFNSHGTFSRSFNTSHVSDETGRSLPLGFEQRRCWPRRLV